MHFYNIIETLSRQHPIALFVDVDGVIAAYDFGRKFDFDKKRPLLHHVLPHVLLYQDSEVVDE